jgi:hypothetical protein
MKKLYLFILIILAVSLAGCNLFNNAGTYKKITRNFVEALLRDDYINAIRHFDIENDKPENIDTLVIEMTYLKKIIKENFGESLKFSFIKSEKNKYNISGNLEMPYATTAFIEIAGKEYVGMLEIVFDDTTEKIINIEILNVHEKLPFMLYFWLFGLLALCVPAFNIYVIIKIRKSTFGSKWIKYITTIFLSYPVIIYNAVSGFSFSWLSFPFLLGIGFNFTGYLGSTWVMGMPVIGFYWLWKLKEHNKMEKLLKDE